MRIILGFICIISVALVGCANQPVSSYQNQNPSPPVNNISYGLIQKTVVKGVSKEQIISALGSPNMITNNVSNEETWIYDKISTDYYNESNSSSASILGGGIVGAIGIGGSASNSTGNSRGTSTQRTLTLIIKFKGDSLETFSVRTTSF